MNEIDKKDYPDPNIFIEKEGERIAIPNPEYEKWKKNVEYNYYIIHSEIPKAYYKWDFKDYIGDKSLENVKKIKYTAENIRNEKFKEMNIFLFSSNNSTQKTAVMCNYGKECIRQGLKVKFVKFGYLVEYLLKTTGFNRHEEYEEILKEINKADMLLIDDAFDKNKVTAFKESSKHHIINPLDNFFRHWFSNEKRVAISSNLSLDLVEENYGVSFYKLVFRNIASFLFEDEVELERRERLNFNNLYGDVDLINYKL